MIPLEKIVCSYEIASRLKELGVPQQSLFFRNAEVVVSREGLAGFRSDAVSLCSAFTSEELLHFLPPTIPLDKGVFVPNGKTYELISDEDLESFRSIGAMLVSLKTIHEGESFLTKYAVGGTMAIAIKLQQGLFHNLLSWGETEADSRGKMLIQLIEDRIIDAS